MSVRTKANMCGLKLLCDQHTCQPTAEFRPRAFVDDAAFLRVLAGRQGWVSRRSTTEPTLTLDFCPSCKPAPSAPTTGGRGRG